LTYFANNEESEDGPGSVALSLLLNLSNPAARRVEVLKNISDPNSPVFAHAGGSHITLPSGNSFVGYGDLPMIREYETNSKSDPRLLWTAELPYTRHSYRSYKGEWHAKPNDRPNLVVRRAAEDDALLECAEGSQWRGFISWNGATDVEQYVVYVDFGDGHLTKYITIPRRGFETVLVVPHGASRVQLSARECPGGREIRRSGIVDVT
jgi:hypothetical protein